MHGVTCQAPSKEGWLPLFRPKFGWFVGLVVVVVVEAAAKQAPGTSSRYGNSAQKAPLALVFSQVMACMPLARNCLLAVSISYAVRPSKRVRRIRYIVNKSLNCTW